MKEFPVQRRAVKGALIISGLFVAVCLLGMPSVISCCLVAGIIGIVAFEFSRWPRTVVVDENELRVRFCLWVKKSVSLQQLEVQVTGKRSNVDYALEFTKSGASTPMFKIDRAHSGIQIDLLLMELVTRGVKVIKPDLAAKCASESPVIERKEADCPCCGHRTLDREDSYGICPVCWWEDDPSQRKDPEYAGGANLKSLRQARESFAEIGASDVRFVELVRRAREDDSVAPH